MFICITIVVVFGVLILTLFCKLKKIENKLDKEQYITEDDFYKVIEGISLKHQETQRKEIVTQSQTITSNNPQPEFIINQPKNTIIFETCLVKHFKNGEFEEVQHAIDACYEISYISGRNIGEFEFKGDVGTAINNRDSVFDDVCEIKGSSNTAKHIKTLRKGKCEKKANNKWQVTQKAIIEYLN